VSLQEPSNGELRGKSLPVRSCTEWKGIPGTHRHTSRAGAHAHYCD